MFWWSPATQSNKGLLSRRLSQLRQNPNETIHEATLASSSSPPQVCWTFARVSSPHAEISSSNGRPTYPESGFASRVCNQIVHARSSSPSLFAFACAWEGRSAWAGGPNPTRKQNMCQTWTRRLPPVAPFRFPWDPFLCHISWSYVQHFLGNVAVRLAPWQRYLRSPNTP